MFRHVPLIVGIVVVAFAIGWLISSLLTPTYRATATITFSQVTPTRVVLTDEVLAPERALAMRAQNVMLPAVRAAADAALEDDGLEVGALSVRSDAFVSAVSITASADDAEDAAAIATAVAEATAAWEEDDAAAAVDAAVSRLDALAQRSAERLRTLEAQLEADAGDVVAEAQLDDAVSRVVDAQQQIDEVRLEHATTGSGVGGVQPASVPGSAASPVPWRDATVAALLAGIAAVGVLWYRSVTSSEWTSLAEETMGGPVLARLSAPSTDPLADARRVQEVEAVFRMAHHTMRLRSAKALTVSSMAPIAGPTFAAELARAATGVGHRVLLVDATTATRNSPGAPTQAAPNGNGAATQHDVRSGLASTGQVLRTTTLRPGLESVRLEDLLRHYPGFPLHSVLRAVAADHDVVVVDAPPLTDASVSMTLESAEAVIVVTHRSVDVAALGACRRTLDLLGATLAGFVVSKPKRGRRSRSEPVTVATAG